MRANTSLVYKPETTFCRLGQMVFTGIFSQIFQGRARAGGLAYGSLQILAEIWGLRVHHILSEALELSTGLKNVLIQLVSSLKHGQ